MKNLNENNEAVEGTQHETGTNNNAFKYVVNGSSFCVHVCMVDDSCGVVQATTICSKTCETTNAVRDVPFLH